MAKIEMVDGGTEKMRQSPPLPPATTMMMMMKVAMVTEMVMVTMTMVT